MKHLVSTILLVAYVGILAGATNLDNGHNFHLVDVRDDDFGSLAIEPSVFVSVEEATTFETYDLFKSYLFDSEVLVDAPVLSFIGDIVAVPGGSTTISISATEVQITTLNYYPYRFRTSVPILVYCPAQMYLSIYLFTSILMVLRVD